VSLKRGENRGLVRITQRQDGSTMKRSKGVGGKGTQLETGEKKNNDLISKLSWEIWFRLGREKKSK